MTAAYPYVAVFDLETTGVDVETARIVTAFFGLMAADGTMTERRSWVVDPGVEIPKGASDVHGYTNERIADLYLDGVVTQPEQAVAEIEALVQATGGTFPLGQGVDLLVERIAALGPMPLVIYNAAYDITVLDREVARHLGGGLLPVETIIDPFVIDKAIDPYVKGTGQRKLEPTAKRYGIALENAHDAEADCIAAGRLALCLLEHRRLADRTLEQLQKAQAVSKAEQAKGLAAYYRRNGKPHEDIRTEWPLIPRPTSDQEA